MDRLAAYWKLLLRHSVSLCAALILAIGVIVTYEIVARWVFGAPTIWSQEIAVYLLVACAFFGFAPTMDAGEHIRIDLVSRRFGCRLRALVELVTCACIAVYAAVATWGGGEMVAQSFRYGRKSLTLLAVPVWIPQLVLPAGMLLLLAVAIVRAWTLWNELRAGQGR